MPPTTKGETVNKDVQALLRACLRQGARIENRNGSAVAVHGPNGFYIVHRGLSDGANLSITRKELRRIGFHV